MPSRIRMRSRSATAEDSDRRRGRGGGGGKRRSPLLSGGQSGADEARSRTTSTTEPHQPT